MQKTITKSVYTLDEKTIRNLVLIRNYLDEVLETLDVMSNPKTMKKIAQAEKEMKEGKVRDFNDLLRDLR
jgi:hypothetical protein